MPRFSYTISIRNDIFVNLKMLFVPCESELIALNQLKCECRNIPYWSQTLKIEMSIYRMADQR